MIALVIPDGHCIQGQDTSRFAHAGNLIVARRPDVIITMGDMLGCESLSHWKKGKLLTREGKRYRLDVNNCNEALDKLFSPLANLQAKQREDNKKLYRPTLYYLMGNHEFWANKFVEENPEMEGFVEPVKNLRLYERGFEVIPYKQYVTIEGIQFTHVPMKGTKPVDGKYITSKALDATATSMVFAHTHRFEYVNGRRLGEKDLIHVATTGCFYEEGIIDFMEGSPDVCWRGVTLLHIFKPGRYDIEQVSLERLKNEY